MYTNSCVCLYIYTNTSTTQRYGSVCVCVCVYVSSVQSLSHVRLFATPWMAAHQASLSITNSWRFLKYTSIESVMPSSHLILCCPLLLPPSILPSIRVFPMSQFFASGGQITGVSASESVLPLNIQDWFPLGWTGWISLQSKVTISGKYNWPRPVT